DTIEELEFAFQGGPSESAAAASWEERLIDLVPAGCGQPELASLVLFARAFLQLSPVVDQGAVRRLVDEAVPGQPLPVLYLVGEGEAPEWTALAFLVRYRQNGFMVLLPDDPEVLSRLQGATSDEEETLGTVPAFKTTEVETETSRRRLTGNVSALLADFDWSFLEMFRRAASGTARVAGGMRLITLKAGGAVVRPLRTSALTVSEIWVNEMLSDASLAEYITAEEGAEDDEAADRESGEEPEITEVEALRSRVRELEANVQAAAQQQPPRPGALKSARPLFPDQPEQQLTEDDWQKLRAAAGAAPSRLAAHERAERKSQAALADTALAEEELGAAEAALDIPEGSPALLQLLATQAKLLQKVMAPKAQDPLTAALAGGASGSDSAVGSSSGARGMAARDAFLRIFDRPLDFAESVANRAQTELGWEAQEPSMMRHYLERKVPLRDLKTVQLFSFFLAHMWEDMRRTGNQRGEFWAARGLVMAEQFAVDAGRTQFGWLLSGLPDVDQGHLINRKGDLRPYGRLSAAPWIAAQVAFLKDVEFLEGRMRNKPTGGADQSADPEDETEEPNRPPRRPKVLADKPQARVGAPISDEQLDMQSILERHIKHFVCAPPLEASSLGRAEVWTYPNWMKFAPWEVSHFKCFSAALHSVPVYLSLAALAMGDALAVEIAQQSHYNVLASLAGSMRVSEVAAYRMPYPRGGTAEYLAIDDHVVTQKVSQTELANAAPKRDTEIFVQAEAAYLDVGLVQHPRKRRRYQTSCICLGAEIDGLQGLVSAPRHRIGVLIAITAEVVRRGTCSGAFLASLLGLWTHVLMYRRPMLALLDCAFVDSRHTPASTVFALSRNTLNELQALVCSCAFGSPFKRPSVWFHNKPWVVTATAGSATCSCSEPHVRVEGTYGGKLVQQVRARSRPSPVAVFGREPAPGESLANLAVVTPVRLCQRIAAGSLEARRGFGRPLPLSVQFECAQRLGLSVCTTDDDDPDDRVALRAFHDDPEWIGELADCLEFSEVLRYRFARQGHINVQAAAFTQEDWPVWLHELCEGRTYRFDVCLAAARVPKLAGRWLRLLLLLGGDIERHPGPVGRLPRGPLDLSSGFATSTRQKMSKSLEAFKQWLAVSMSLSFAAAMSCAESAAAALRGFGLHLYSEGHPRYLLVYAITAVQVAAQLLLQQLPCDARERIALLSSYAGQLLDLASELPWRADVGKMPSLRRDILEKQAK
ncbi:unnamed protein product, partial [Symbiodinium microadriaticum]